MFKHILVPIDLGGRHTRALRIARQLAGQCRARVTLLHVVQRIAHIPPGELRGFYAGLERSARQRLERAARLFVADGRQVRTEVRVGQPTQEIVRLARRSGIDLIVMGSHSVQPRRPGRGWGTTSYKVGLLCRCPILLVK